jgi:predicted nucleic acid-binding protein
VKLLVDTNVLLDVILDRQPHSVASGTVWAAIETGKVQGVLAAHALTTIYYLVRREQTAAKTKNMLNSLLRVFGVATVDQSVIEEALEAPLDDFEDAVTAAAARRAGCDLIVSRDPKGFRGSLVRMLPPETVVPLLP